MLAALRKSIKKQLITDEIQACIDQIPKPVGAYGYDPWGYNVEGIKLWMAVVKPLYEKYFRVKTLGLENIPSKGRALIVANHSGQIPIDGGLIGYAMATNKYGPRAPRAMIERWIPTLPFVGNALNEAGAVIGDPVNCVKMLRNDEAVIVFPEGVRGIGKPYSKAYQLQRFGTGFMHIALQEGAPIVPVGVVGCEESIPSLGNFKALASLLRAPYIPLALWFPLPTQVILNFGKPIQFAGQASSEDEVAERVEHVKGEIDALIQGGLKERTDWFR